jgi:hypothetical protein
MYLQYKYLPEGNRPCVRASRERGYTAHVDALQRIHRSNGAVDTSSPIVPPRIGRNYKRYENETQRNQEIERDNHRLIYKMDKIIREEHYPRAAPQRPFTLQGQTQKDEMWRITHENHKILTAVQERRPILNRNDWLRHELDHEYQVTKNSEYLRTVPMGDIIRDQLSGRTKSSRRSTAPLPSGRSSTARRSASIQDD